MVISLSLYIISFILCALIRQHDLIVLAAFYENSWSIRFKLNDDYNLLLLSVINNGGRYFLVVQARCLFVLS